MRLITPPIDHRLTPQLPAREGNDFIDVERLLKMAFRQAKVVGLCAAIGLALGLLYLQTTPPSYTSISRVLIDEGLTKLGDETTPVASSSQTEAMVLSQIEILRSARLAGTVVDKLDLSHNSNFMHPPSSLFGTVFGYARGSIGMLTSILPSTRRSASQPAEEMDESARQAAVNAVARERAILMVLANVMAQRVGRSLVIDIGYQAHDRELATTIARAYADAYLADQLNASFDATEQAAVWMQGRLNELRDSSQAASLAVEKFRSENGLASAKGTLITDQQLSELSAQLTTARADTARAQALSEQFKALAAGNIVDSIGAITVPAGETAATSFTELRSRYQNIVRRQKEIETNFGVDHPQALALKREADKLLPQLSQEIAQLADGFRNEYEVALAREAALKSSLEAATGQSAEANQSQVRLRELEQQAAALSALYQSYLDRYERASQQQSFPVAKVRIISQAMTPLSASAPRSMMVMGLSLFLGLMLGSALGAIFEFNERFFRTGEDVIDKLGVKFLGYLPVVTRTKKATAQGANQTAKSPTREHSSDNRAKMRVTVTMPSSMFAETLRNAKIAGDIVLQHTPCKVIGIISVLPGEGKSTVAGNFAGLLAATGSKTLVIDGDLRNPGLSRHLGVTASKGLVDAIVDQSIWRSVITYDRRTNLAILPGLVRGRFTHSAEALSSLGMQALIKEARKEFDYIVVDLPPLGPVVDAKAFAPLVDGFLAVVEWGRTPRALVKDVMLSEPRIADKLLGVVLNKVRLGSLAKYATFGGSEQFLDTYSPYYIETKETSRRSKTAAVVKKIADANAYLRSVQR